MKLKKYKEPKAKNSKFYITANVGKFGIFVTTQTNHIIKILLNNYACKLKMGSYEKELGGRVRNEKGEMFYFILKVEICTFSGSILIIDSNWKSKKEFYNYLNLKHFESIQPLKKEKLPKVITDIETWEEKEERERKECKTKNCPHYNIEEMVNIIQESIENKESLMIKKLLGILERTKNYCPVRLRQEAEMLIKEISKN